MDVPPLFDNVFTNPDLRPAPADRGDQQFKKNVELTEKELDQNKEAQADQSAAAYLSTLQAQEKNEEIVKFLLNGLDIVMVIKMSFQGKMFNPNTNQWEKVHEPILSEESMGQVLIHLTGRINHNTMLGVITEDTADYLTWECLRTMTRELASNAKKWGIKREYWDRILNIIESNVHICYTRSIGGRTMDNITQNISHVTMDRNNPQNQQQGGLFNKWKRGW